MSMQGCRSYTQLTMKITVDRGFLQPTGTDCWATNICWSMTVYVSGGASSLRCGPG